MATDRTLAVEQAAFDALLPSLLESHAGQYVLFKDGQPVEFFDGHEAAFNAGLERFGLDAVFLVAPIEPPAPRSVSLAWDAGVMFG